jgi:hypothetical protein
MSSNLLAARMGLPNVVQALLSSLLELGVRAVGSDEVRIPCPAPAPLASAHRLNL